MYVDSPASSDLLVGRTTHEEWRARELFIGGCESVFVAGDLSTSWFICVPKSVDVEVRLPLEVSSQQPSAVPS